MFDCSTLLKPQLNFILTVERLLNFLIRYTSVKNSLYCNRTYSKDDFFY